MQQNIVLIYAYISIRYQLNNNDWTTKVFTTSNAHVKVT